MKFSCKDSFEVSEKEVSSAYAMAIHSGDLVLKKWDSKVEAFLARVHFLHVNFPEYGIETLDEDSKRLIWRKFAPAKAVGNPSETQRCTLLSETHSGTIVNDD